VTATRLRLPIGFAGADAAAPWPRPHGAPRSDRLARPLDTLPRVGSAFRAKLAKLGLETVADLLEHRPFRYESPVPERRIADLFGEEEVVIAGEVQTVTERRRGRLRIVTARVADDSGRINATWFNQPWLVKQLRPGRRVRLRGRPGRYGFDVRSHDLDGVSATADFAPVYPASEDVSPKKLRELVEAALPYARDFGDGLPAELRARQALAIRADSLATLHRPRDAREAERARARLAFEELLVLQVAVARRAREREQTLAPSLGGPGALVARYRDVLPFTLTPHQEAAIRQIDADLERTVPMQRLLQGDVGSGKTVVALYALLRAVENGRQGALMAPTETLAEQHFFTIEEICTQLGVTCALLTSASPKAERERAATADLVVGTHALIQEGVDLAELAVAVVDEQHRFGVAQRQALAQNRSPHVLHMTATPIPRTLALTVYGDLAVSEIAKPPANRRPIVTSWITEDRATEAYTRLRRLLDEGRQAYVVCPLIEESETSKARAAEQEADRLRAAELRGFRVGCLHGRLRPGERRELMRRFKECDLDVLVATTVIEVGVDVPNATVMIVQEADRFGLAQLHQLRGRVGRGAEQSYCLLVSRPREELTDAAQARLQALVATTDGFELAEVDLELRGAGELLGTRQSGLTDLKFAHLLRDRPLLELARAEAPALVDDEGPLGAAVDALGEPAA
jgi:ATP-dependent DNA helicase RecG